jgi:5'-nucleotidase
MSIFHVHRFDMDYTLAQYNAAFDLLAFDGAKARLHSLCGYPAEVLAFEYNPHLFQRGLLIDKKRGMCVPATRSSSLTCVYLTSFLPFSPLGNVLKIDRHKYARKAFHGMRELTREERKAAYHASFTQSVQFSESNFVNIDSIFLVIDAMLFSHMVDLKDGQLHSALEKVSYEQLYKDVRRCVDLCHRDGAIKDFVMNSPEKYILYDRNLVPMLQRYKMAGKKVFLLTNRYKLGLILTRNCHNLTRSLPAHQQLLGIYR